MYLGADAPLDSVTEVSSSSDPSLLVLSAVRVDHVERSLPALRELARQQRVALGGAAARHEQPETDGILRLSGELVADAARLTRLNDL